MAEHDQRFESFEQWVSRASHWLTRHPQHCNTEHGETAGWRGNHFTAICFDTSGRLCRNARDMKRAHDEGCFPVRWIWPDQVPELVRAISMASEFACDHCADAIRPARNLAKELAL